MFPIRVKAFFAVISFSLPIVAATRTKGSIGSMLETQAAPRFTSPTADAVPTSRRKPLARFHEGDCQHKRTPVHCVGVTAVGSSVEIEINDDRYDNEGQPSGCCQ